MSDTDGLNRTAECQNGCTLLNQHNTDCPGECRGCLPRPCTRPNTICDVCVDKLHEAVHAAGQLTANLRDHASPVAAARALTDDPPHRRDPAESTVLHAATLDLDDLWRLALSWVGAVVDGRGLAGPKAHPWDPAVFVWLAAHLDWCAGQGWAADMRSEVVTLVGQLRHRWPGLDGVEPRRYVMLPCPTCKSIGTLVLTPPSHPRQQQRVDCLSDTCGAVFLEDTWDAKVTLSVRAALHRGQKPA